MECDPEVLAKESRRQRDLWLLALGAALADDKWRPRLKGYCGYGLTDLAAAVREGKATEGWRELRKWDVLPAGKELAVERVFAELDAIERRRKVTHVVNELAELTLAGDESGMEAKAKEVLEVMRNGKG